MFSFLRLSSLSLSVSYTVQTLQKQFRYPNTRPKLGPKRDEGSSSEGLASANASSDEALVSEQTETEQQKERKSVHERIRVPVSYDDLFGEVPVDASEAQGEDSSV